MLRPQKDSLTLGILISRSTHLDHFKKYLKVLILFWKNSVALVLFVVYIFANFCILIPSFRYSNTALTWTYTLSFGKKNKMSMLDKIKIELVVNIFNK